MLYLYFLFLNKILPIATHATAVAITFAATSFLFTFPTGSNYL